MRFRIDPELAKRAGLTARQQQAIEFYDGSQYGHRFVAHALGISRESARDLVRAAVRKLEKALREEQDAG